MSQSIESGQRLFDLEDERPPRFSFVNRKAINRHSDHLWRTYPWKDEAERDLKIFEGMPTPVFKITDPDFAPNYFDAGVACFSARLREVLDLPETAIRYRPVDLDGSTPQARAQDYQAFEVVQYADPFDWDRTEGVFMEFPTPADPERKIRTLPFPTPDSPPHRIYWREDFKPPAPIFRVTAAPTWIMVTDELADRVMRARIPDVVFIDRAHERARTELVLRRN